MGKTNKAFCCNLEKRLKIGLGGYLGHVTAYNLIPSKISIPKIKTGKRGIFIPGAYADMELWSKFIEVYGETEETKEILQGIIQDVRKLLLDHRMILLMFAFSLIAYRKISGNRARVLFRRFFKNDLK